jgi:hypothetical protein
MCPTARLLLADRTGAMGFLSELPLYGVLGSWLYSLPETDLFRLVINTAIE